MFLVGVFERMFHDNSLLNLLSVCLNRHHAMYEHVCRCLCMCTCVCVSVHVCIYVGGCTCKYVLPSYSGVQGLRVLGELRFALVAKSKSLKYPI